MTNSNSQNIQQSIDDAAKAAKQITHLSWAIDQLMIQHFTPASDNVLLCDVTWSIAEVIHDLADNMMETLDVRL